MRRSHYKVRNKMLFPVRVFYSTLIFAFVVGEQCDESGILVYEDLGCIPEYGNNKTCPIKYSCKGLEPSSTHCYFRGKTYEKKKSKIDESLIDPLCRAGCSCEENGEFNCATVECPTLFGHKPKSGCYFKYSVDQCCATGEVCSPFDNIEKCLVEGKEYREGEKFYPSNTCYTCICQKGFKGKFEEPFCKRVDCAVQLIRNSNRIQQSCAAFYIKSANEVVACCPESWLCPDGSEIIKGEAKSEDTCKFGDKKMKVGQHFERLNFDSPVGLYKKVKCECVIPPLVKCTDV